MSSETTKFTRQARAAKFKRQFIIERTFSVMKASLVRNDIEQPTFAAEVNLSAGVRDFRRRLREHQLVRELSRLAIFPDVQMTIVKRIEELSQVVVDPHYENPFDAALSAYLTVLRKKADPKIIVKAATAASKAHNCLRAKHLSHDLLKGAAR